MNLQQAITLVVRPRQPLRRILSALLLLAMVAAIYALLIHARPAIGQAACTISWDGGAGTVSWHAAGNWSEAATNANRLPNATDQVCLPSDTAGDWVTISQSVTIDTLQSSKPMRLTGGTFVLGDPAHESTITDLTWTAGVLQTRADSTVAVTQLLTWKGGTKNGLGTLRSDGVMDIDSASGKAIIGGTVANASSAFILPEGTGTIRIYNGGRLHNLPDATFDVQVNMVFAGEPDCFFGDNSGVFRNDGSFLKSGGTGGPWTTFANTVSPCDSDSASPVLFHNSGSVAVWSGAIVLAGGGTHTGSFEVNDETGLNFAGGIHAVKSGASVISAGRVTFGGGQTTFADGSLYESSGTTAVPAGEVSFQNEVGSAGSEFIVNGGAAGFNKVVNIDALTLSAGWLGFGSSPDSSIQSFAWTGGMLFVHPNGSVDVGDTVWKGGVKTGAGTASFGTNLEIAGGGTKSIAQGTMRNDGSAVISGSGNIAIYGGGRFLNSSFATVDDQVNVAFVGKTGCFFGSSSGVFRNDGTFTKSGGTGAPWTTFANSVSTCDTDHKSPVNFNNFGLVQIHSGALVLSGGGTHAGVFEFSQSQIVGLNFSGGTHKLKSGAKVAATIGNVTISGGQTTFEAGSVLSVSTGKVTVNGGRADFLIPFPGSGAIQNKLGDELRVLGGTIAFWQPVTTAVPITLSGGWLAFGDATLSGPIAWTGGTIQVFSRKVTQAHTVTWSGGTKTGLGTLRVTTSLAISGSAKKTINGGFFENRSATATLAGTGNVAIFGEARFVNAGTLTFQANTTFVGKTGCFFGSSSGVFRNDGTLKKTGATGPITFSTIVSSCDSDHRSPVTFKQTQTGSLELRIGGLTGGTPFDQIRVGSSALLSGSLKITPVNGFYPDTGNGFKAITYGSRAGTFTAVTSPWCAVYNPKDVTLVYNTCPSNLPPTVNAGADVTISEGGTFTGLGSFTDADSTSWTATVDYGDDSEVKALTLTAAKTFNLSHAYAKDGIYTVTVSVTDNHGRSGTDTVIVTVNDTIPDPVLTVNACADATIVEGGAFTCGGSFSDPDSTEWTGMVDYGDGSEPEELAINANMAFSLNHVYNDEGVYTVTVTVIDDSGELATDTVQLTVTNATPMVNAGSDQTVDENIEVSLPPATFSDAGVQDSHTATIDWGDGDIVDAIVTEDGGAGTVAGSHAYAISGVYTVTLCVADDDGGSGCDSFTVTVGTPVAENQPPVAFDQLVTTDEDVVVSITLEASDPDGGPLTWTTTDPAHGTLTGTAPNLTYTPDSGFSGGDAFTFKVNDTQADSNVATVTINVVLAGVGNRPPVVFDQTVTTDQDVAVEITLLASDPDGDPLTWIHTSPTNGALSGDAPNLTYTPNAGFVGSDGFTFSVSDTEFDSNIATVTIEVNAVEAPNGPPDAIGDSYTTDEDMTLTVAAPGVLANDTDPDGDSLTVILVSEPANGTVTLNAEGSFEYEPNPNFNGSDSFTYQASDGAVSSVAVVVSITVNPVNDAPVAVDDSYSVNEDETLDVSIPGVLANDLDADGNALAAILVSGTISGSLMLNDNGSFSYTPSSQFSGVDSFTYQAHDGQNGSNLATVVIMVNPANDEPVLDSIGDHSIAEGSVLTFEAIGSDADGDALTFSVTGLPAGAAFDSDSGVFTWEPDDNGAFTIAVRVSDSGFPSLSDEEIITITVVNVAPTATFGNTGSVNEGSTFTLSLTESFDPSSVDIDAGLEFAFDCGDGAGFGAYGPLPNLDCPTTDEGSRAVWARIRDKDGGVNEYSATVEVAGVAPAALFIAPPAVNEGSGFGLSLSDSADPSSADLAAGFEFAFDCGAGYGSFGAAASVSCEPALDGPGTLTVRGTIKDKDGVEREYTANVAILNVSPSIGPIVAPLDPQKIGTAIAVSAPFTDPSVTDTHTAVWEWGDGATSAGGVDEASGSGSVSGSHAYPAPGVYTVKLTVTDDDGDSGESIFQYVVIYDPNGGFVTGGGWIDSPVGAYTADPTLSGKANFGFVSKYQKGANVPTGNTEFQFHAGNLNFKSVAYDWLVISGPKAQYKGTGSINGAGEYGFLLTANDGQVSGGGGADKFRIKIWDKTSGEVVYDNQLGGSDDQAASQVIGGGSVVIHSK
jgi:VCBS repeat-containing protein